MCSRGILAAAACVLIPAPSVIPAPPVIPAPAVADENSRPTDAASWGADHVGRPFPQYMTGDECLFCHRDTGTTWSGNRHQRTIRIPQPDEDAVRFLRQRRGDAVAAEVQLLMGSKRTTRFLKRSGQYGKLEIHSTSFVPSKDEKHESVNDTASASGHWEATTFGNRCAGCHATAVDPTSRAFSAVSLDCVTCHGDVQLEHSDKTSHALLSTNNKRSEQVASVCGQCHLRGGKSKSSHLPYPNTFVPGDNLFRDFQVDFSNQAIINHSPIDQHIFQNSRDVAVLGQRQTDCLTCHDIHGQSTAKHQQLADSTICATCHFPGSDKSRVYDALLPENLLSERSRVCDY